MSETCRRLRRLYRKHSSNVARHDKTPVKSTLFSCDKNILSRDMSLEVAIHALSVCLLLQCCDIRHNFLVSSSILQNTYSMKQPDLYYSEAMQMTSQAQSKFTENTRLWLVFSIQNLTSLVTSFLWSQNSIDQAVS